VEHLLGRANDLLQDPIQGVLQELHLAGDLNPALQARLSHREIQQEQVLWGATVDWRLHYEHEPEAADLETPNIKYAW